MVTICCTAKLLKRTGFPVVPVAPDPTTALGNWYANLLIIQRKQFLLFVSDLSRLAVITPAKDARSLASHLTQQLSAVLEHLNVPSKWIDAEIHQMAEPYYATTRSRSVLGTMNEYKFQMEAMIYGSEGITPLEMAIDLLPYLVGPLQYRTPGEVTLDLLKRRYELS